MQYNPHNYQQRGIELLTKDSGGAGLLLDPGMGKTVITLCAFDILKDAGHAKKMLVVAPIKPMYGTWRQEAEKWDHLQHLKFKTLHGAGKAEALHEEADIYLINPEGVQWLCDQAKWPNFDILCIDESTKFKSSSSKRFKSFKKHLTKFDYRWILTGTFVPNGLLDLFSQVFLMDLGEALGKYVTHYKNKYFHQTGFGGYTYEPFPQAADEIAKKIAPMTLRLNAEDYLDMPEFNKIIRRVDLPEKALKQYKEIEKDFIAELQGGTIVAANAAAAGTKCRQIANGAVFDENREVLAVHEAKMQALEEIVEETNGQPLIVVYEFTHDRDRIMKMLGKTAVCITGVTGRKYEIIQQDFNAGNIPYLVMHSGSSHGLNIHGSCHHMVWFSVTWNLEWYIQTKDRLYRQGQASKMVLCYILVASKTLDERVVDVLGSKTKVQDDVHKLLMGE
tara:strand:+ start:8279 stop:9622 length:1344 start_codon:yes stop_codon:yes gene_type:complete